MATWEDLDNESGCNKDDAKDEANVVVGLVATEASDAEPETDSEDENEIWVPKSGIFYAVDMLKSKGKS